MRSTVLEVVGLALLVVAAGFVAVPLGVAVAGAEALYVARQQARGGR